MIDNLIFAASMVLTAIWFAVMWLAIIATVGATGYALYLLIA